MVFWVFLKFFPLGHFGCTELNHVLLLGVSITSLHGRTQNGQLPQDFAINMHWLDFALWLFLLGHLLPSSSGKMMKTSLVTFTRLQNRVTPRRGYISPESFALSATRPSDMWPPHVCWKPNCEICLTSSNFKLSGERQKFGCKQQRGARVQTGRKDGKKKEDNKNKGRRILGRKKKGNKMKGEK